MTGPDKSDLQAAFLDGVNSTWASLPDHVAWGILSGETAQRKGGKATAGKWRKLPDWAKPIAPAMVQAAHEALSADPALPDKLLEGAMAQAALDCPAASEAQALLPDQELREAIAEFLTWRRLETVRAAALS